MSGEIYTNEMQQIQQLKKKISFLEQENKRLRNENNCREMVKELKEAVFENSSEGMVILNGNGVILEANSAIRDIFYIHKKDMVGRNLSHYLPQEHRDDLWAWISMQPEQKAGKTERLFIENHEKSSYTEIHISSINKYPYYLAVFKDVTYMRNLEKRQHKDAALFRDFFTEALDGIVLWKENGQITKANKAALGIFESTQEEIMQHKISDYVYEKDKSYLHIMENLCLKKSHRDELMFLMPNGQKKLLEFTTKLHSVDGLHMSIFRNITSRYKMELELLDSKSMFETIFEEVFDGVILWDRDYKIIDINKAALRLLSKDKEGLIGVNLLDYLPEGKTIGEEIKPKLLSLRNEGQNRGIYTATFNGDDWTQLEFRNKYNIYSGCSITTLRDITENAILEEQIRKSSTLHVIGELAAGIAHEIRNPMTALKGFIQLLESSNETDKHAMYFTVIKSELSRIETIINEFLLLSKPQNVKFVKADLQQIMNETLDLLNAQAVLFNIQFTRLYTNSNTEMFCEPNQLKKVFINIVKNGMEVLESGGEIKVSINPMPDYFHIIIEDNGIGLSKEKLAKLGEPFYTTKEKGTGLGLMVSFKIIKEHEGKIEVESEEGVGTKFHIYLPRKKIQ